MLRLSDSLTFQAFIQERQEKQSRITTDQCVRVPVDIDLDQSLIYNDDKGTTAFMEETKAFDETLNAYLAELQGEMDRPEPITPFTPISLAVKDVQTKSQQK